MKEEILIYQIRDNDIDNVKTIKQASENYFMCTIRTILNESKKAYELAGNAIILSTTKGKWVAKSNFKYIGKTKTGRDAYAIPMWLDV